MYKMKKERRSPDQHASETKPGTILKGNDKNLWVCKSLENLEQRWVRTPIMSGASYITHNNGGCPFKVYVNKSHVSVYEQDESLHSSVYDLYRKKSRSELERALSLIYIKKVWETKKALAVYPGVYRGRHYPQTTRFSKGNSVLVRMGNKSFVYIQDEICRLTLKDRFKSFHSPLGNNDVPYPWIVGEKYTYLLAEKIYLENTLLDKQADPYERFYNLPFNVRERIQKENCVATKIIAP